MKKLFLFVVPAFIASVHANGQAWMSSSPNTIYGINNTTALTPLSVGIGTNAPTAQFHTTEDVRFEGLPNDDALTQVIVSDASGNLAWRDAAMLTTNAWLLDGNGGTDPTTDFLGTTDAQPVVFRTQNIEQMRINAPNALSVGTVEIGQPGIANGNLAIHGRDIVGNSFPFIIDCDITNRNWGFTQGANNNTCGRMMRLDQRRNGVTNYYDIGVDSARSFFISERTTIGGTGNFPRKMITISDNHRVGINMNFGVTPSAIFHTIGSVRHQGLTSNSGTPLVVDVDGNVFVSNAGILQNSCGSVNMLPKVTNANGNLGCSQVFDNGTSVGINTTAGFNYTGGGAFTAGAPGPQAVRLDVNGLTRSVSYVATSDSKYKTNIAPLTNALEKVMRLDGVEYNWKVDEYRDKGLDHLKHSGFIAQELEKVLPNSVIIDEAGDYAVDYNSIIPVLVEAIKQQQAQIEELKKGTVKPAGVNEQSQSTPDGAKLYQNMPNPFDTRTEIKFYLPETTTAAAIAIFDMNGRQLKRYVLDHRGDGSITIGGEEFVPGMYLYSLLVDGREVDTKRMVLAK